MEVSTVYVARPSANSDSSALVGLTVMVVLLPVPGWLTSLASGVEDEKMKKVGDFVVIPHRLLTKVT